MELRLVEKRKYVWELPKHGEMRVPGRVYGDEKTVEHLHADVIAGKEWNALKQIYNVACLPGICKASLAMPDVHPGYGFPIGGVGAFNKKEGVFSVGGVGFDAGCNVANIRIPLKKDDVVKKQKELAEELFKNIPAGLGRKGEISVSWDKLDEILARGANVAIEMGYGMEKDLEYFEKKGSLKKANPDNVSELAKKRENKQLGTLGSGNHYLEVQYVDKIFDEEAAKAYGIEKDGIAVAIHCGSRALGHQVGTDYLKVLDAASKKYKIPIRERELVCAPIESEEGQRYFSAVCAAINYSYANKEVLIHLARKVFKKVFGLSEEEMPLLYVITHNSVMEEKHKINGKTEELIVHRKGATRAFGPGSEELPREYQKVGQPVLVGGTMGTCSYILRGTQLAMEETFGSACFTGDTRIITDKGIFSLEEIYKYFHLGIPFYVPSLNPRTLKIEWKPVVDAMYRYSETIEISISRENSRFGNLKVTPDHKFIIIGNSKICAVPVEELTKLGQEIHALHYLPRLKVADILSSQCEANLGIAVCLSGILRGQEELQKTFATQILTLNNTETLNFLARIIESCTWNSKSEVIEITTKNELAAQAIALCCLKLGIFHNISRKGCYTIQIFKKFSSVKLGVRKIGIVKRKRNLGIRKVYNITVADNHNYFVLTDALTPILVKNCHGAGRRMSRMQAVKTWRAKDIINKLAKKGIIVKGHGMRGIAEECPEAYKDVVQVVNVMHYSGIATKVAELKPLVCIKG